MNIILGDYETTIEAQPVGRVFRWRNTYLDPVIDHIFALQDIDWHELGQLELLDDDNRPTNRLSMAIELFGPLARMALGSPEMIVNAVIDWQDDLKENRDLILDTAVLDEFVIALRAILGKVYPLDQLGSLMGSITGTQSSSPAPNGDGAKKKRPKRVRSNSSQ